MTNREARRHGPQLKPRPGARGGANKPPSLRGGGSPSAGPPGGGSRVPSLAGSRGSMLKPDWVKGIWAEIKKVQWPTRQEAWNLTLVVLLVSIALGVALGGIDTVFGWFMQNTVLK